MMITIEKIIDILKHSGLLSLKCSTEEEILHKLYVSSNDRQEILKWAISQLSEKYADDIQNSEYIEHELVRKLIVLGFVENSAKWNFVKGQMEKEEQMNIYKKLFRALELIQLTDNPGINENNNESNESTEKELFTDNKSILSYGLIVWGGATDVSRVLLLQKRVLQIIAEASHLEHCRPLFISEGIMTHIFTTTKGNTRRKHHQDFDLVKATETLKVCDDVLEEVQKIKKLEFEESTNGEMNPTDMANMDNYFKNTFDSSLLSFQKSSSQPYVKPHFVEIDAAVVEELHSSLQCLSYVIEQ